MGQFVEFRKSRLHHKRRHKLPKSLLSIKKSGLAKAFFSQSELRKLLDNTGEIVKRVGLGYEIVD
jgi:hypothetical protein